jgi:hypothetical protein
MALFTFTETSRTVFGNKAVVYGKVVGDGTNAIGDATTSMESIDYAVQASPVANASYLVADSVQLNKVLRVTQDGTTARTNYFQLTGF